MYQEVRISFFQSAQGLRARAVATMNRGEASEVVDEEDLRAVAEEIRQLHGPLKAGRERGALENWGSRLFKALIVGDLQSLFDEGGSTQLHSQHLRLCLDFDLRVPELAWLEEVPWELLYWPRGETFLALDRRFSLVRSLSTPLAATSLIDSSPVTSFVVASSPADLRPLDTGREIEILMRHARGHSSLRFLWAESAVPRKVRQELLRVKPQIFHFLGHGYEKQHRDGGTEFGLCFENEFFAGLAVSASDCAYLLKDTGVRLVVLNACKSAGTSIRPRREPFFGVAQRLIRAGIPSVVAMRFPIHESSAKSFAGAFYRSLSEGDSIEEAMVEARHVMFLPGNRWQEWFVPALYLRATDSALISVEPDDSRAPGLLGEEESGSIDFVAEDQRTEWKVYEVAFLWHDQSPPGTAAHWFLMSREVEATKAQLHAAIDQGLLPVAKEQRVTDGRLQYVTRFVSREALVRYCQGIGVRPAFLFREERK